MPPWANENAYDAEIRAARVAFPSVPVSIIKAVMAAESGFNPNAFRAEPQMTPPDGSSGLMQLLMKTARVLGYGGSVPSLYLPAINVYYGTKLLAQNYTSTGSWPNAISAYNGGHRPHLGFGRVASSPVRVCLMYDQRTGACTNWRATPVGEYANQSYVDKVLGYVQYFSHDKADRPPPVTRTPIRPPTRATELDRAGERTPFASLAFPIGAGALALFLLYTRRRG